MREAKKDGFWVSLMHSLIYLNQEIPSLTLSFHLQNEYSTYLPKAIELEQAMSYVISQLQGLIS